jgi:DNA-binding MarR family transcriptional regulator
MVVKADTTETSPEGTAAAPGPPPGLNLDADLSELLRLMPRVFRGLRAWGDAAPADEQAARLKELFHAGPLGPRHMPVMVVLMLEEQMAVSDLAQRLGLSVATTSLMTGELARAGLVERREDERDRRRTLVSVTEEYRAQLVPLVRERIGPVRRGLERMDPEVRAGFLAGWRLLAAELDSIAPDAPAPAGEPG